MLCAHNLFRNMNHKVHIEKQTNMLPRSNQRNETREEKKAATNHTSRTWADQLQAKSNSMSHLLHCIIELYTCCRCWHQHFYQTTFGITHIEQPTTMPKIKRHASNSTPSSYRKMIVQHVRYIGTGFGWGGTVANTILWEWKWGREHFHFSCFCFCSIFISA